MAKFGTLAASAVDGAVLDEIVNAVRDLEHITVAEADTFARAPEGVRAIGCARRSMREGGGHIMGTRSRGSVRIGSTKDVIARTDACIRSGRDKSERGERGRESVRL